MAAFEDVTPSGHRLKTNFLCSLWSWANLYIVDNIDSLVDFFDLVRLQVSEKVFFFLGSLFYTSCML